MLSYVNAGAPRRAVAAATAILLGLALWTGLAAAPGAARATPVDLELVLVVDASGSIDEEEFRFQRESYAAAIADPRVARAMRSGPLGAVAIAFVEWGGPKMARMVVPWMRIADQAGAEAFADAVLAAPRSPQTYNSIGDAIDLAVELIRTNAYEGTRAVIDVSGDGPDSRGRPVREARDDAVAAGITINALAILSRGGAYTGPRGEPLQEHYRRDVIGGPGAFVVIAEDERSFAFAILSKLVREIAGTAAPATLAAGDAETIPAPTAP